MLKTKTVKMIEVGDWDHLVESTYGKHYNFQQQDDCKDRGVEHIVVPADPYDYDNDTTPEVINGRHMGVSFSAWLKRDSEEWNGAEKDKSYMHLYWERNFYPHVSMVINDLHAKGLLEAGEYKINIDW